MTPGPRTTPTGEDAVDAAGQSDEAVHNDLAVQSDVADQNDVTVPFNEVTAGPDRRHRR